MSNDFVSRVKSAGFMKKFNWQERNPEETKRPPLITNIPMSESRYSYLDTQINRHQIEKIPCFSRIKTSKSNASRTSQIWRIVNSTRSEFRLKSLNSHIRQQEPIRLNLVQKVERIKSKHKEREYVYQNNLMLIQKIKLKRTHNKVDSNLVKKGQIQRQVQQIIKDIDREKRNFIDRHRTRMLKISKR